MYVIPASRERNDWEQDGNESFLLVRLGWFALQPRIYIYKYIQIAGEFGFDGDCLPISQTGERGMGGLFTLT